LRERPRALPLHPITRDEGVIGLGELILDKPTLDCLDPGLVK